MIWLQISIVLSLQIPLQDSIQGSSSYMKEVKDGIWELNANDSTEHFDRLLKIPLPAERLEIYKSLANLTSAAYCAELVDWECVPCTAPMLNVTTVGDYASDAYAYIAHSKEHIVVGFRGSRNFENWARNLMIAKPDTGFPGAPPGAKVHYGFLKDWEYLSGDLVVLLNERRARFPGLRVVVVGHSLGGALAILCVMHLITNFRWSPADFSVVTYNQPRVGNQIFADWYTSLDIDTARIVNQNDLTPHLPPDWIGFVHTPTQVWIEDSEGNSFICGPEDQDCANSRSTYSIARHLEVWGIPLGIHACM